MRYYSPNKYIRRAINANIVPGRRFQKNSKNAPSKNSEIDSKFAFSNIHVYSYFCRV